MATATATPTQRLDTISLKADVNCASSGSVLVNRDISAITPTPVPNVMASATRADHTAMTMSNRRVQGRWK